MLIGIGGKAGAGKDTIGDYLVERYNFEKIALADPIKRLVKDVFVLTDDEVYDREKREQPMEKWGGWSVRRLLQFIGTELFRNQIDDTIWVKSLLFRVKQNPDKNYVVTDVRFPNELEVLSSNFSEEEFTFIKVTRPGHDGAVGISGHASEAYDLESNYTIDNDGTFEDLYAKVDDVLEQKTLGQKTNQEEAEEAV